MKIAVMYGPDEEVSVACDREGARRLIRILESLAEGDDHFNLFSPAWGGDDLSEDWEVPADYPQREKLRVLHSLTFVVEREPW